MNDPGLDSPISEEAKAMENEKQSDEQDEVEEDEQAFLAPRYLFSDVVRQTRKAHLFSILASFLL